MRYFLIMSLICPSHGFSLSTFPKSKRVVINPVMNVKQEFVPDMQRRSIMNIILLTSSGVPVLWMLAGFIYFFIPPTGNGDSSGVSALDANGDVVKSNEWIKKNAFPNRNLVQGLKGDAHYLIVKEDETLEKYALNAVCTHLGCVVPWNKAVNKFMCPCHGSQYSMEGSVVRGPAPLPLALANLNIDENDNVILSKWEEVDFRSGNLPWWS